jgi:hypothetical protein
MANLVFEDLDGHGRGGEAEVDRGPGSSRVLKNCFNICYTEDRFGSNSTRSVYTGFKLINIHQHAGLFRRRTNVNPIYLYFLLCVF